jgi:hypothetical protein
VIIEVSDSTYATDVGIKLPAYLAAGAPAVWIVNLSNHNDPMVEVWTPGTSQPTVARDRVSSAGVTVSLALIFDGLPEIAEEEE